MCMCVYMWMFTTCHLLMVLELNAEYHAGKAQDNSYEGGERKRIHTSAFSEVRVWGFYLIMLRRHISK